MIDSFFMMGLPVSFVLAVFLFFFLKKWTVLRQLQFLKKYSDCQREAKRFHCFKTFKHKKKASENEGSIRPCLTVWLKTERLFASAR